MKQRSSLRTCARPGCPTLTARTYCAAHQRQAEAERGNWRQRGYDNEYDRNKRIVIREETNCGICGEPVNKTLPGTHPDGPTADHIIRRQDGGSNQRDNLRLAHLHCNAGRRG